MKKLCNIFILTATLMSVNSFAGDFIIGTGALGFLTGIPNAYFQGRISDRTAFTVEFANANDISFLDSTFSATGIGGTFKGYVNNYANGVFWKLGAAYLDVSVGDYYGSTSAITPIALVGYEKFIPNGLVYGGEAGWGTTAGFGLLSLYLGYKF